MQGGWRNPFNLACNCPLPKYLGHSTDQGLPCLLSPKQKILLNSPAWPPPVAALYSLTLHSTVQAGSSVLSCAGLGARAEGEPVRGGGEQRGGERKSAASSKLPPAAPPAQRRVLLSPVLLLPISPTLCLGSFPTNQVIGAAEPFTFDHQSLQNNFSRLL